MSKPAALIFDMDGTLLDTEPLYTDATQKVLDPFEVVYTPELKQRCIGGDSHNSANIVIDHFNLPMTSTEFLKLREVHLLELFKSVPPMPGADRFIERAALAGHTLGIATSSHAHLADIKLANREWTEHFSVIITGDDPALERGKPAPDIFLLCAEKMQVDPTECIAFEDSPNGVTSASAAGMKVIAINSPYVEPGSLVAALKAIDHYDELDEHALL